MCKVINKGVRVEMALSMVGFHVDLEGLLHDSMCWCKRLILTQMQIVKLWLIN